jgi:hypothetical protein
VGELTDSVEPAANGGAIVVMFTLLLVVGTALFVRNERNR